MDFGTTAPEISSARMYSGPGAGSWLLAAAAWEAVGDGLYLAAGRGEAIVAVLVGESWLSPAAAVMAATASTYFAWLSSTAAQAQQTAGQLLATAAAFEAAFAATVPPPVVAANRALVAMLTATNVLGINTPAIANAEALYGQMWAQNAVAMYEYAAASATALAALPVFTSAIEALQQLGQPLGMLSSSMSAMSSVSSVARALGSTPAGASGQAVALPGVPSVGGPSPAAGSLAVLAEVGGAASTGRLSVPRSWATRTGTPSALARPVNGTSGLGVAQVAGSAPAANVLGGLPLTATTRGENVAGSTAQGAGFRGGFRPTFVPRSYYG